MRYRKILEEEWVNAEGESRKIRGSRPAEIYQDTIIQVKERDRELDDFAVAIWGENSEILSYRLREQNVERLLLEDFNERAFTEVSIPPRL